MTRLSIALVTAMLLLSASTASATTHVREWTGTEALDAGAHGSSLKMEITNSNMDPMTDPIWLVVMTLDTNGFDGGRDGFNQIGFGAIKDWDLTTLMLLSVTGPGDVDLSGGWGGPIAGNITSGLGSPCTDMSNLFKVCVDGYSDIYSDSDINGDLVGEYVWTFQLTGGYVQGTEDWHWGGQYSDLGEAGAVDGWIISTDDFIIPEPSAALVFAMGFGVISAAQRKQ